MSDEMMIKYYILLTDENTKQNPKVQRLLQYPEVQEVFFDPSYLKSQEAAESPNVAELLAVLDGILSEQQNNRTNGTATQNNTHFSSTK